MPQKVEARTFSSRVDEHGMVRVREVRQAQSIPGGQVHLVAPRSKLVALHAVLAKLPEAPLEVPDLHCSATVTVTVGIVNRPFVENALKTTHLLFPEPLFPPPNLRFFSDPAPTANHSRRSFPAPALISATPVSRAIPKFPCSLVPGSAAATASSVT